MSRGPTIARTALTLAVITGMAGCGDDAATGPEDGAQVVIVGFRADGAAANTAPARAPSSAGVQTGTLELSSLYLVVDEFKLEGNEGACDVPNPEPDCGRFEAPPHLVSIPLVEGETEIVIEEEAPTGVFTWLKFETKAVAENPDVQAAIQAEGISDWPADASLLVTGVFTPDGAPEGEPFRAFFDAEVKIVLPLPDPLVVTEDDLEVQTVFIVVDPGAWFLNDDGFAMDLVALDYDLSGQVHKLEVKLEDGFTKIELG